MTEAQVSPAITAAQRYETALVPYLMFPAARILLKYADPQPGESMLDVACGTGVVARVAAPLIGPIGSVIAVDIQPAMLEVGRSLPTPEGATIEWREGSVAHLPLPDASFDLVTCQHGLPFFPDRLAALQEMRRVLAPGGRLAVAVWGRIEQNPFYKTLWEGIARLLNQPVSAMNKAFDSGDPLVLKRLIDEAGFTDTQVAARELMFRQPWSDGYLENTLISLKPVVPTLRDMSTVELSELSQVLESEIGSDLRSYVQDGAAIMPGSINIAIAWN
jgi:ubiquinone/menaquinone biosynthesis C-methylase UbiE